MKVDVSRDANTVTLKAEIPVEQVSEAMEKAYLKMRKDIALPGFRKGKVPRNILEKRYGVEVFYEEASNILLNESYPKIVGEHNLEPVDHPDVNVDKFSHDEPFVYQATVTVKPVVTLGQYKDLDVAREEEAVDDDKVEAELKNLQLRRGKMAAAPEGTEAVLNDQTIIDFVGRMDGEEFEGGQGTNYALILGSGNFIPGFEEQLMGAKAGDTKLVKVTMPADYHAVHLVGKDVEFEVKINEIKRRELPQLNDEFAKEVSEFVETLEELKKVIRETLEERAKNKAVSEQREKIVSQVRDNAQVEIPAVMVEKEIDGMVRQTQSRFESQGLKFEDYLQYTGKELSELRDEKRSDAEKNVKTDLVIEQISKAESLTVTEDELSEEVAHLAQAYQQKPEALRKALEKNGRIEDIQHVVLQRKTVDWLVQANDKNRGQVFAI